MNAAQRRATAALLDHALDETPGSLLGPIRLPRSDALALRDLLDPPQRLRVGAGRVGEGRTAPTRPKKATSTVPAVVREAVLDRAAGLCEACGDLCFTPHLHHRKLRSQGGQHTVENLVSIHTSCHDLIHRTLPRAEAERLGLIVPSYADPARVPVAAGLSSRLANRETTQHE